MAKVSAAVPQGYTPHLVIYSVVHLHFGSVPCFRAQAPELMRTRQALSPHGSDAPDRAAGDASRRVTRPYHPEVRDGPSAIHHGLD